MSAIANVGDTVRIKVVFRVWDSAVNDYGPPVSVDNDDVQVDIYKDDVLVPALGGNAIRNPSDTELDIQHYYYDIEFDSEGIYLLEFSGLIDGEEATITEEITITDEPSIFNSLIEDEEIIFVGSVEPLYVDPEMIHKYFPDSSLAEVTEVVHKYSVEIDKLLGDYDELPFNAHEYVQAASLCSLNQIHGSGLGGSYSSMSLGDLALASNNAAKSSVNRANASDWCEIAAVLRNEIVRGSAHIRAIVAGSNHASPMPRRTIRNKQSPFRSF